MRKRPCLVFACIFLAGIAFQRYDWKPLWFVPGGILSVEVYCGLHAYDRQSKHVRKILGRIAGRSILLLSAFFLGISHMKSEEDFRNVYMAEMKDGSKTVIFGEILTTQETEYGNRLILTDCYISLNETIISCNQVMVYVLSDQYQIGQIYQIKGKIQLFEHARNEGNFDEALFYQSQKIDFAVYASESILLGCKENVLKDAILQLKEQLKQVYIECMEDAPAGFYVGMILGDKTMLLERTKELFSIGGISHILAISGLHMSIIGRGFYKFLRKCKMGFLLAGILAGLLLVGYCYMTGSGTSAIRAVGMMLVFFMAQYVGRSYDMLNALGAVVVYLLWQNPFLIEYSGFQFSVTALLGVGFVGQTLAEKFDGTEVKNNDMSHELQNRKWTCNRKHMSEIRKGICSNFWMSMGITLTTLPMVANCYFEIPLYSPIVNSLLLVMLSPIFILALFGGCVGCFLPVIGCVILIPCRWMYVFYELVCEFVEGLPWGSMITGKQEMEIMVLYYLVLFIGISILKNMISDAKVAEGNHKIRFWKRVSVVKVVLSGLCFFLVLYPKNTKAEIIFLDVGQGDAVYIASEDGTTYFIDGGSSDVNQVGTYCILPFLKAHGVKKIDYWFVSHADTDHVSGLLEVIEAEYEICHLVISDKMPEDERKEELLSLAERQGIFVIRMKNGECIQTITPSSNTICSEEGICITCLYPWKNYTDRNEQSMVLLIEFFDRAGECTYKALFSGDISTKGEAELIQRDILIDVDLYKAAHHGSKSSNSKAFLYAIQPEICVISCGKDNSYGHPHAEVIESMQEIGAEVIYTMECGQVTIFIPSSMK